MERSLIPHKRDSGSAEATECVSTVTVRERRKLPISGTCRDWGTKPTRYCCQPSVGPAREQVCLHLQRFRGISHRAEPLGGSAPSLAACGAAAKVGPGEHQGFGQQGRATGTAPQPGPSILLTLPAPCPTDQAPHSEPHAQWAPQAGHAAAATSLSQTLCLELSVKSRTQPAADARCCAKREQLLGAYSMVSHVPGHRAQAQPHPTGLTSGSARAPTRAAHVSVCPSVHLSIRGAGSSPRPSPIPLQAVGKLSHTKQHHGLVFRAQGHPLKVLLRFKRTF